MKYYEALLKSQPTFMAQVSKESSFWSSEDRCQSQILFLENPLQPEKIFDLGDFSIANLRI